MSEHDQERISELSDELDCANEKIKCLEADLANALKAQAKPPAPEPPEIKVFKSDQKEGNFDSEAVALIRHLKAKGLVLVVFAAERGSGMSVQFTKDAKEIINDVPTFLRRLASRMEFNLIKGNIKGLDK